mmetsp:Transcript_13713/g.12153  ORF Transcript_13713/g.12153 Transcript_13713/m.12153 type:complete len:94 (-) Transcript_13713:267-548(-)
MLSFAQSPKADLDLSPENIIFRYIRTVLSGYYSSYEKLAIPTECFNSEFKEIIIPKAKAAFRIILNFRNSSTTDLQIKIGSFILTLMDELSNT